jgi:hypothetical protein
VTPSGDVKLINFALPKPLNDRASGVPAYLSPEQVQGKPVDQRSNTYSLAAILYHLITGEPPFQGTPDQILDLHLSSPALAPSQRRPEANLSPEVDRVILKALDKNSSRRHLTLRLFLQEVEALTAAAPVAASAGSAAPAAGAVGYAKTMLFAGGQAEVASMVAKAIASRGGAPAAGASTPAPATLTAPAPRSVAATPAPVPVAAVPVAPAAVSPIAAVPTLREPESPAAVQVEPSQSAAVEFSDPAARLTPPPVTPFPPMRAAAAPPAASTPTPPRGEPAGGNSGKGAAFRETLWFKKGDVEHMIAEAKAKLGTAGKPADVEVPTDDARPLEDRYLDDGSLSVEDRKKFSLRSGGTVASMGAPVGHVPGESMSAAELAGEVSGSKKNLMYVVIGGVVVVAIVAVVALTGGSKGHGESVRAPAATGVPTAPPAPPPPPKAAEPSAPAVAPPAAAPAGTGSRAAEAAPEKAPGKPGEKKGSRRASKAASKKKR